MKVFAKMLDCEKKFTILLDILCKKDPECCEMAKRR